MAQITYRITSTVHAGCEDCTEHGHYLARWMHRVDPQADPGTEWEQMTFEGHGAVVQKRPRPQV
jgi:hypothetical protein